MAKRSRFQSRNMSLGMPNSNSNVNMMQSGMISPGYAGIIQSARREASKLNFEISGLDKTAG